MTLGTSMGTPPPIPIGYYGVRLKRLIMSDGHDNVLYCILTVFLRTHMISRNRINNAGINPNEIKKKSVYYLSNTVGDHPKAHHCKISLYE